MTIKQTMWFWLSIIILGSVVSTKMATAHYIEEDPNHAHVCTYKDPLTVRETYNINSTPIGTVAKGSILQVVGNYYNNITGESWVHIKYKDGTGFVNGAYICY